MYSLWLIPDCPSEKNFQDLILDLSERFDTLAFAPHITLISDISGPPDGIQNHCRQVLDQINNRRVTIIDVLASRRPFMSLFAKIALDDEFLRLRQNLAEALGVAADPDFLPHLSLAYAVEEGRLKQQQLARLGRQLRGIDFDIASLDLVSSSQQIPIPEWQKVVTLTITGGENPTGG